MVKISSIFVAFLENMNFNLVILLITFNINFLQNWIDPIVYHLFLDSPARKVFWSLSGRVIVVVNNVLK